MANQLNYMPGDRYCPEHEIQKIEAEYFAQAISEQNQPLEGICFDRERNFYFVSPQDGSIRKFDMTSNQFHVVFRDPELQPVSVKIHRDGRLYLCSDGKSKQGIFAIEPDGSNFTPILTGWCPDDMVFDSKGGFYFNNFSGDLAHPTDGVYYVDPECKSVTPVLEHMIRPNGIALSTDEKVLWVTEMCTNRLYRIELTKPSRSSVAYRFTGFQGADSCSIDADDNLYVAMVGQGLVKVLNPYGWPIADIRLPGRREGRNLRSTHPMVHPDRKEVYITACDEGSGEGSWIFRAPSFAKGNPNAFQIT